MPETRKVAGWDWDDNLEAYVAPRAGPFSCHCGSTLNMPGHHTCGRCGKIWNGYTIGTGGDNREASAEKFLVREIPVRPDVIVADREAEFRRLYDPTEGMRSERARREREKPEEDDEFPSDHHPRLPKSPATPADWSRRDRKNDFAPQQLNKRRQPA